MHGGELYLCEHRCSHDGLPVQQLTQIVVVLEVLTLKTRKQSGRLCNCKSKKKKKQSPGTERLYLRLGDWGQRKWRGYCRSRGCERGGHFLPVRVCCVTMRVHPHKRWGRGLLLGSRVGRRGRGCFKDLLGGKRWARQRDLRSDLVGGRKPRELVRWCLSGRGGGRRKICLLWGNRGTR